MFGTFSPETEQVVYGLTHPVNTFNPVTLQIHSYQHIWRRLSTSNSWREVFSILFKGPGWEPGKPRLGLIEDIEEVDKNDPNLKPYDPQISQWYQVYCCIHFLIILLFHVWMAQDSIDSRRKLVMSFFFILFSLTSFGLLMDGNHYSKITELVRCATFFWIQTIYLPPNPNSLPKTALNVTIRAIYYSSIATWSLSLVHKKLSTVLKAHRKSS